MIKTVRNIDWVLLGSLFCLTVVGSYVTYIVEVPVHPELWPRGGLFWVAGLFAFGLLCFVPLCVIERISCSVYGIALVLLVLVMFFGDEYRGAIRHFDLGVMNFYPADLMQWAFIMALAWWFSKRETHGIIRTMVPLSLTIIPMFVLFVLPDLEEIIFLFLIAMTMIIIAKKWRLLAIYLVGSVAFLSLDWNLMHAYQKHRLLLFFNSKINAAPDYGLHFYPHFNYEPSYGLLQSNLAGLSGSFMTILTWAITLLLIYRLFIVVCHAQSCFAFILSSTISLIFALYLSLNIAILSGYVHAILIIRPLTAYSELSLVFMMTAMGIVMRVAIESKDKSAVRPDEIVYSGEWKSRSSKV